jgi:hypothetical protein
MEKLLRVKEVEIKGRKIIFNYPTIASKIQTETQKNILTMGHYATLSIAITATQIGALQLLEKICVLNANVLLNGSSTRWEDFEEDEQPFVEEVFSAYEEWRLSFRKEHTGFIRPENDEEVSK